MAINVGGTIPIERIFDSHPIHYISDFSATPATNMQISLGIRACASLEGENIISTLYRHTAHEITAHTDPLPGFFQIDRRFLKHNRHRGEFDRLRLKGDIDPHRII
ncbi:hypothetical protein BMS3Bbin04_01375 [bacterium BMS3Bbin04]|nr:hypothetical protein BMS3Bbin04_01375 [bacterium BMS3Bbin04]